MDILEKIIAHKRLETAGRKAGNEGGFEISDKGSRRSLRAALAAPLESPRVIAEVKKASPSAGCLLDDFAPLEIAADYQAAGAAAISVVTDEKFFQGCLEWLTEIRQVVNLPVLRKDFIVDPWQLEESAAAGADAVLLIAAVLKERELADLMQRAAGLGLECLVEIRDRPDAVKALAAGAELVGINNRNLSDFSISLATSEQLSALLPAEVLVVSESGIDKPQDLERLRAAGINAFLVGSSLVRAAGKRRERLRELINCRP